jgi:crossover junction endodeoxyribonuclease RuvC
MKTNAAGRATVFLVPGSQPPGSRPVILGIDPGLRSCGWGVVRGGPQAHFVACGAIRPRPRDALPLRLRALHEAVEELILTYRPDEVAVEDPFVGGVAPAAALAIGQARAVAGLAAAEAGLDVSFYAPAAVKLAVAGYGRSDKRQIQTMVRLRLELAAEPEPADAADALAVALCHLDQRRLRALEAEQGR